MNKRITVTIMILVFAFFVYAQSNQETEDIKVNLAVMQGPTGFSSAMLSDYINVFVYPSPNEATAKLVNGELDMAVLPANSAANLYNKGINIKVLAIVGEGMLSVLGTEENTEELYVPGVGGTPDHMAVLLYPEYERNYGVSAPAQLAQLLIAGKCKAAILPQPFVNMVLNKNPQIRIKDDVQERWKDHTGTKQYPMSVLVVSQKFLEQNRKLTENVESDYKKSVAKVFADPHGAALTIEKRGIMKAELAEPAIRECALVFKEGKAAQRELESYYKVLNELAPQAIGGKMPDLGLYGF